MRIILKCIRLLLISAVVLAIGLLAAVIVASPGRLPLQKDAAGKLLPGAVSDIVRMPIGGVEQGMIIRGADVNNPVMLMLHGGPGSPEYPMLGKAAEMLESRFTVCYWDQRGAGMSYDASIPPQSMTLDQLVSDTREVTQYLLDRFDVQKVYLLGHSWGSYLGVYAAKAHPELYHAFIGMGQVADQLASEQRAYDYMLRIAKETGDTTLQDKLLAHPVLSAEDLDNRYMGIRSSTLNKLGVGLYHKGASTMCDAVVPVLFSPAYRFMDKANYMRGLVFAQEHLWLPVVKDRLAESVPELAVPVYIMQGAHDYQTSYTVAKEYFDVLIAPEKHFLTFEESAHSPLMEEPERFMQLLDSEVLGGI